MGEIEEYDCIVLFGYFLRGGDAQARAFVFGGEVFSASLFYCAAVAVCYYDDALRVGFGAGEPDFDTPWRIREEGMFSLEKGRTFYTSNAGLKELRKEICNYLERKIHVKYDGIGRERQRRLCTPAP
mgnify:CR=1 FL=1